MERESSNIMEYVSRSADATVRLGATVATMLNPGDVVALIGNLGGGKTQFVRGLATGLEANPRAVSSPTFVLMNEYAGRIPLVHIDAYRLNGLSDLESIGWSAELLGEVVTAVEWADRIEPELPTDRLELHFEHLGDEHRRIVFELRGRWAERREEIARLIHELRADARCPICGAAAERDSAAYPFCSERCKLVDLGRWFKGSYTIPGGKNEPEEEI